MKLPAYACMAALFAAGCSATLNPFRRAETPDRYERLLDIEVRLPANWDVSEDSTRYGRILRLNNFRSRYLRNGFLPDSGAEITLIADASETSVDDSVREYLGADSPLTNGDITVSGCRARLVESVFDFKGPSYSELAIFLPLKRGDSVAMHKLILTYNAGEDGARFIDAFNDILDSIKTSAPCGQ